MAEKEFPKTQRFRQSGVALPIFSLPSNYGIGNVGQAARKFVDFLSDSGFSYWSILPLGPTSFGDSPFQSFSSKALNHYFIDLDDLIDKGLLKKKDFSSIDWGSDPRQVDYAKIYQNRVKTLKIAFKRFKKGEGDYQRGYATFLRKKMFSDYACFMVLKEKNQDKPWNLFVKEYRSFSPQKFLQFQRRYRSEIEFYEWTQYIFLKQWEQLMAYAHSKNVKIIGEMPMHVSYDSIDVYKHHRNFILDEEDKMEFVAGYPPDVFYEKGQCWGTPLYNFDYLKRNEYHFLKDRLSFCYDLYDLVILDHFRGYIENYEVKKGSVDGMEGKWTKTPGKEVIDNFISDKSRVIAENVDFNSKEMEEILKDFQIRDMRVLEFGFPREMGNFNKPVNYEYPCISYSTTHDCKPLRSYFEEMSFEERQNSVEQINSCCEHFGVAKVTGESIPQMVEAMLELNLASLSSIAIQSMPDLLCQGKEGRINTPGSVGINWRYRVTEDDLSPLNAKRLRALNKHYGRCD